MIPRLFLDCLTLNFKLQLHTYLICQVNTILPNLLVSPIRDQTRCQTILHNRSRVLLLAHLGPHQSDTACSSRLVLCSRMPSPLTQSFFTPNHDSRDCSTQKRSYLIQPCETSHLVFTSGLLYHIFPSHPSLNRLVS